MNNTLGVHSEVGQLRQAIIHRPGLELSRLTPSNCDELLFDDVLWASKAREEHDVFAHTLREHGVQVHLFTTCSLKPSRFLRREPARRTTNPRQHRRAGWHVVPGRVDGPQNRGLPPVRGRDRSLGDHRVVD